MSKSHFVVQTVNLFHPLLQENLIVLHVVFRLKKKRSSCFFPILLQTIAKKKCYKKTTLRVHTQTDLLHLSVVLIPAGYMIICFYDHLFITTTKEVSAQECTVSTANSRAADGVILRCQLSGDVNTCPALVSAHQATHGGFLNACVRKSPSGDSAMCVIPQISLLFRAEGGRE